MRLNKIDNTVLDVINARVCVDWEDIDLRVGRLTNKQISDSELEKSLQKLLKQKLIMKVTSTYNGDDLEIYFPAGTSFEFGG